MIKDRSKAAIRKRTAVQLAPVKQGPKQARDWRAIFLHALRDGASAKQAARIADVFIPIWPPASLQRRA